MEIHELNTGTPSLSHYIGMDTGSDTYKTTPEAINALTTGTLIYRKDSTNKTTYTFSVRPIAGGGYTHFLLIGGTGWDTGAAIVYHGFVNTESAGYGVTLTPILAGTRTFAGSFANDTLTITASNTVYGGLRLLWLV